MYRAGKSSNSLGIMGILEGFLSGRRASDDEVSLGVASGEGGSLAGLDDSS